MSHKAPKGCVPLKLVADLSSLTQLQGDHEGTKKAIIAEHSDEFDVSETKESCAT